MRTENAKLSFDLMMIGWLIYTLVYRTLAVGNPPYASNLYPNPTHFLIIACSITLSALLIATVIYSSASRPRLHSITMLAYIQPLCALACALHDAVRTHFY